MKGSHFPTPKSYRIYRAQVVFEVTIIHSTTSKTGCCETPSPTHDGSMGRTVYLPSMKTIRNYQNAGRYSNLYIYIYTIHGSYELLVATLDPRHLKSRDVSFWVIFCFFVSHGSAQPGNKTESKQFFNPIGSMYGIFTYIYHKNQPNVGVYTSPMDPMGTEGPQGYHGTSPSVPSHDQRHPASNSPVFSGLFRGQDVSPETHQSEDANIATIQRKTHILENS